MSYGNNEIAIKQYAELVEMYGKESQPAINAKNEIVIENLNLVRHFAFKIYSEMTSGNAYISLSSDDMFQFGVIGLMKGIENFDPTLGYKLSTYVSWWIIQQIHQGCNQQNRLIRVPYHSIMKLNKIIKLDKSELSDDDMEFLHRMKVISTKDLDHNTGENPKDGTMLDTIENKDAVDPFQEALADSDKTVLMRCVKALPGREQVVITMRWGLDDGQAKTLQEIGDVFNCSRERIRQVEQLALYHLRVKIRKGKFDPYYLGYDKLNDEIEKYSIYRMNKKEIDSRRKKK